MDRKMATAPLRLVLVLACLVVATACSSSAQDGVIWPTGGWPASTPEEQDMDPARLAQMMALTCHDAP